MEDLLKVGVITTTHGVRGEVKVFPTTDDFNRFKKLKEVILDTDKEKMNLVMKQHPEKKILIIEKELFKTFMNSTDLRHCLDNSVGRVLV